MHIRHPRPRDVILAELHRLADARAEHTTALAHLDRHINRLLEDFTQAKRRETT